MALCLDFGRMSPLALLPMGLQGIACSLCCRISPPCRGNRGGSHSFGQQCSVLPCWLVERRALRCGT